MENLTDPVARDRVIAVINGKGCVGKTTVTANVAGLLAQSDYRVLAIDLDTQGNLGLDLGYADTQDDDGGRAWPPPSCSAATSSC
ncbi:ParA family protein [Cellulomonas sp. C5510]|uniref:ParA family protein n=1 Tax=Cellulomonas sp. C5510 TaxID=2871170 RepID=UPI001C95ED50|nr:ParA family protein [Cellulomonas sp. C5510]QZN85428.1 ParA family protein [Cellulomonas sp. C5510]